MGQRQEAGLGHKLLRGQSKQRYCRSNHPWPCGKGRDRCTEIRNQQYLTGARQAGKNRNEPSRDQEFKTRIAVGSTDRNGFQESGGLLLGEPGILYISPVPGSAAPGNWSCCRWNY